MTVAEKIQHYVQRLPADLQSEALHFIEYLFTKSGHTSPIRELREWSDLSLSYAMRGMEDENDPIYSASDLKVIFS